MKLQLKFLTRNLANINILTHLLLRLCNTRKSICNIESMILNKEKITTKDILQQYCANCQTSDKSLTQTTVYNI